MGEYASGISRRSGNVVYMDDGAVYALFRLTPPAVDVYSRTSIESSQDANSDLFAALSTIDSEDFLIGAYQSRTTESEIISRVLSGAPAGTLDSSPRFDAQVRGLSAHIKSGRINEKQRVFILAVRYPSNTTLINRITSRIFNSDPFEGLDDKSVSSFSNKVLRAIPASFKPVPETSDIFDFLWQRHISRGVHIPEKPPVPTGDTGSPIRASNHTFTDVETDIRAVGDSYAARFAARFSDRDPEIVEMAERAYRRNYRRLGGDDVMAVTRGDNASAEFPGGQTSYQSVFAVTGYPSTSDKRFQSFFAIVDQATGMDGDFVMRFNYNESLGNTQVMNKNLKELDGEERANTKSVLDASEYSNRKRELYDFHQYVAAESSPITMEITVIFAFGSASLDVATRQSRAIRSKLEGKGFRTFTPAGGADTLWESMLPGTSRNLLTDSLSGQTTALLLGAYSPFRRYQLGDGVGVPVAVDIGNAQGGLVHLDLLNAAERGNPSITVTGAQGKGKSYLMKQIAGWLLDMDQRVIALDSQGEWATFLTAFPDTQVIDLYRPTYSIDPFKVITDDPQKAAEMFLDLMRPMLGIRSDSEEAAAFAMYVSPESRELYGNRNTSRQILENIVADRNPVFRPIMGPIRSLLNSNFAGAFIDPVVSGVVQDLPPANLDTSGVVFVTRGLRLAQPGTPREDMSVSERYAMMANTAVAYLSSWAFERTKKVGFFIGEEMSFYDDQPVLVPLIKDQDRAGRKHAKGVMVGSQTADEFLKDEYALVRNRFVMGQEKNGNAELALAQADFPVYSNYVSQLVHDTSPPDPDRNNLPKKGREGEGFFNNGFSRGRIKVLPQLVPERSRRADTSSKNYIRYERG